MKDFALIGAAGYIAPRHMKAIQDTNNRLVAAMDSFDSVGIIDSYFPNADFFTEFERFDRHIDKLKRNGKKVDYVSICSPNYLHDSHIRFGLRNQADVICEKPIVLNPWNIEPLVRMQEETQQQVYSILQLRLHENVLALKKEIEAAPDDKIYDIDLTYLTSRGHWYYTSWKGDNTKSGGIATNIGVHFFDMLTWIFGEVEQNTIHIHTHDRASGMLRLKRANVRWFLSINYDVIPEHIQKEGKRTYRSIQIEGKEFEFSKGFTELHSKSYQQILDGKGFSLEEAAQSIQIVHDIRHAKCQPLVEDYHPLAKLPLTKHPFSA